MLDQPKVEAIKVTRLNLIEWMKYEEASSYSTLQEAADLTKEHVSGMVTNQKGNENYNYDYFSLIIHGLPNRGCRLNDDDRFPTQTPSAC